MSSSPSAAHLLALLRRNASSPAVALRLFIHLSSAACPPPPRSTSFLASLLATHPATADTLLPGLLRHLLTFPDPAPHLLREISTFFLPRSFSSPTHETTAWELAFCPKVLVGRSAQARQSSREELNNRDE